MILQLLTFEEGFSAKPYFCSEGFPTIGIGEKIGCKGIPLSAYCFTRSLEVAQLILNEKVVTLTHKLNKQPWFAGMDTPRQDIIVSMAYQMGIHGLFKFRNMITALIAGRYEDAAKEALDSTWARQTPARAKRHAAVLADGDLTAVYSKLWG